MNRWLVGAGAWIVSSAAMVTLWWVHTFGIWGVIGAACIASVFVAGAVVALAEGLIKLADIAVTVFDEPEEK